jgi:hypothetical protein
MKDQLDKLKQLERSLLNKRNIEDQLRKEIKQKNIRKPKSVYKKSLSPLFLSPLVISKTSPRREITQYPSAPTETFSSPLFSSKKSSSLLLEPEPQMSIKKASSIKKPSNITLSVKEPSFTEQDIENIVPDSPIEESPYLYSSSPPPYEAQQIALLPPEYPAQSPSDISFKAEDLSYRD